MKPLRILFLPAVLLLAVVLSGCQSVPNPGDEQSTQDTKPWNTPSNWEGTIIGIPY